MMTQRDPSPKGRPRKHPDALLTRVNIRLTQPVMAAIVQVHDEDHTLVDVSDAIRLLLVEALKARGKL